ncbi:cob(I)yrinic acid a,c-diamide adenosyltransferase [Candidatus Sumerlaeota bacterium]|nr:cob(I)yrinic acid a,c-diamide adenosyltransferase [Candidatus Sumerlaeota bacterium]
MRGYIQVYTGNGKGKTTAALGLALRAAGAGKTVFIAQFLKCGRYSECRSLARFHPDIVIKQFGKRHFIKGKPSAQDISAFRKGFDEVRKALLSHQYDLIILDEINIAVYMGLMPVDELILFLREKPDPVELVLTGRHAHARIVKMADLVTHMREVKHYFQKGVPARRGIEM